MVGVETDIQHQESVPGVSNPAAVPLAFDGRQSGAAQVSFENPAASAPPVEVRLIGPSPAYQHTPQETGSLSHFYGNFNTSLFDCSHEPSICLIAFCCFPCFLPWRIFTIIERVGSMQLPIIGLVDRTNAFCYALVSCLLWCTGSYLASRDRELLYTRFGVHLFTLVWVFFCFCIRKGVASRFQIEEGDLHILLKSWCCFCCGLLQVGRHVDAYATEAGYMGSPTVPLVGLPVSFNAAPSVATVTQSSAA